MTNDETLNQIFSALADPTRRAIVMGLMGGKATVSEIARPFNMSLPAVSKHLRLLEATGIIHREVEGRKHYVTLNARMLRPAASWLDQYRTFWGDSFDALAKLVESQPDE